MTTLRLGEVELTIKRDIVRSISLARSLIMDLADEHQGLARRSKTPNNHSELDAWYPRLDGIYDGAWSAILEVLRLLRSIGVPTGDCPGVQVQRAFFITNIERIDVPKTFVESAAARVIGDGDPDNHFTKFSFNHEGVDGLRRAIAWCDAQVGGWLLPPDCTQSAAPQPSPPTLSPGRNEFSIARPASAYLLVIGGAILLAILVVAIVALVRMR